MESWKPVAAPGQADPREQRQQEAEEQGQQEGITFCGEQS
jgi:hypothetical protein